jgi:putative transposase
MHARSTDPRQLQATGGAKLRFLIRFLRAAQRTIQAYGLTLFHIRYWHPIFVAWREPWRTVTVRYHPEDLSRVFVTAGPRDYLEVQYADLRRPAISLFEQRTALKAIRSEGQQTISEALIFVEEQQHLIANARRATARARRRSRKKYVPLEDVLGRVAQFRSGTSEHEVETVDYDAPVQQFDVEQW